MAKRLAVSINRKVFPSIFVLYSTSTNTNKLKAITIFFTQNRLLFLLLHLWKSGFFEFLAETIEVFSMIFKICTAPDEDEFSTCITPSLNEAFDKNVFKYPRRWYLQTRNLFVISLDILIRAFHFYYFNNLKH